MSYTFRKNRQNPIPIRTLEEEKETNDLLFQKILEEAEKGIYNRSKIHSVISRMNQFDAKLLKLGRHDLLKYDK